MCAQAHDPFIGPVTMSTVWAPVEDSEQTRCHEAAEATRRVVARLAASAVDVSTETMVGIELEGTLKQFQGLPWEKWPSWARGLFGRLYPRSIYGCSAFATQMKGTGMLTGPGCATTAAASSMGLQTTVIWDGTANRAMARLVLAELREAEDVGDDEDDADTAAPLTVRDAAGAEVDVEVLASDAWEAAEGALDAVPPAMEAREAVVGTSDTVPPGHSLVGKRVRVHWPDGGAW